MASDGIQETLVTDDSIRMPIPLWSPARSALILPRSAGQDEIGTDTAARRGTPQARSPAGLNWRTKCPYRLSGRIGSVIGLRGKPPKRRQDAASDPPVASGPYRIGRARRRARAQRHGPGQDTRPAWRRGAAA